MSITKYENKSLLLNVDLAKKKAGDIIKIKVDKKGIPIKRYWRDRIKDSKIDNCVTRLTKADEEKILADREETAKKAKAEAEKTAKAKTKAKKANN